MKGLFTPSPGDSVGGRGFNSSSSSPSRHRFNQVSLRSSRQPSSSDGQPPHQLFSVLVPTKPRYVPKPDARPKVASAPYQTINAPFRISRKILSKEVLSGGSIIYNLGAFLPSPNSADNAVSDIIQVSASNIDDHVSYEELERFEHEEFESELARENEEIEKLERRQTRDLLRGSFKKGRGRPKKKKGLSSPLNFRLGGLLGHVNSDIDGDSGDTESEISSTDLEGPARSNHLRTIASKTTDGRRFEQVRVEIPIRSNEKERAVSKAVVGGNRPKLGTSLVQSRLAFTGGTKERSPKGNATSSIIGISRSISGSSRDGGKVAIKSNKGFSSHEPKNDKPNSVSSSTVKQKINIESVTSTTKTVRTGSYQQRPSRPKAEDRERQTPVDQPKLAPVHARTYFPPKILDPIVISDGEGNDGDGEDFVSPPQKPQSRRSTHQETDARLETVIPASPGPKSIKKDNYKYASDVDTDEEVDILLSRFAPTTTNLNPPASRPPVRHDSPHHHQSLKSLKPPATSQLSNDGLPHQAPATPSLPSSIPSKHPKSSSAFIPDTDSEDDLVASEQLLREFEGEKSRATDTADSLLGRFQNQPLKHTDPPSSSLKSSVHKDSSKSNKSSTIHKYLMSPSSKHGRLSMTSPFPSGKPIRCSLPPTTKGRPQTDGTKLLVPPGESENDSSTKKRKRNKHVGQWRTVRSSNDPEAEWSPKA